MHERWSSGSAPAVAQAGQPRVRGLAQPRRHRLQQRRRRFAGRQLRTGHVQPLALRQHQQQPFGAAQLQRLVHQELLQRLAAVQQVHAHAGFHQPLEGLAQLRARAQVGLPA